MLMLTEQVIFSWQLHNWKSIPKNISCVYKITHTNCEDFYIGRTNNLYRRAAEHHKKLIRGKHQNPRMQNVHNKYNDYWSISVVFEGSVEDCTLKEQKILDDTDLKHSLNCHLSSAGGSLGNEFSKDKVLSMLDWAVANSKTRDEAIKTFKCSWDSLRKYQHEWESINGVLNLPLRATGEKSGNYKHGNSQEIRRKRTDAELEQLKEVRSEMMMGENNPMYGKTHTEEARVVISECSKRQWEIQKSSGYSVSEESRRKVSEALKGVPKSTEHSRAMAASNLGGKIYNTPFGLFYTSRECEEATGIKAATVMWRCKITTMTSGLIH